MKSAGRRQNQLLFIQIGRIRAAPGVVCVFPTRRLGKHCCSSSSTHASVGGGGGVASAAKAATESCLFLARLPFPSFQSPTLLQGIFARSPPHIAPLIAFATDPDTIYLTIFPRIYPLTPCAPPGRWCLASPLSLIQSMINGRTADRSPLSPLRLRRRPHGRRTEERTDGKSARTTTTTTAVLSIGL